MCRDRSTTADRRVTQLASQPQQLSNKKKDSIYKKESIQRIKPNISTRRWGKERIRTAHSQPQQNSYLLSVYRMGDRLFRLISFVFNRKIYRLKNNNNRRHLNIVYQFFACLLFFSRYSRACFWLIFAGLCIHTYFVARKHVSAGSWS